MTIFTISLCGNDVGEPVQDVISSHPACADT